MAAMPPARWRSSRSAMGMTPMMFVCCCFRRRASGERRWLKSVVAAALASLIFALDVQLK